MSGFDTDALDAIRSPRQRASDLEGSVLGSWKLVEKLSSSGGFGVVYKGRHTREEMGEAAVKVFAFDANDDPDIHALFSREIGILKKLTDAQNVRGVPRIYDAEIESSGLPWIAMQYIDGKPLDAWVREKKLESGRPSTPQVVRILRDVLSALDTVQEAYDAENNRATGRSPSGIGIIHRDLKPSNVLVEKTPVGLRAWVIDFGIAGILQPARSISPLPQTATMTVAANALTLEYASPEMRVPHPNVDPRSDVFQVGLIGYELLTGHRYWDTWPDHCKKIAAARYPWWLKRAIRRAIQWDRDRRFTRSRQFLAFIREPYQRAVQDAIWPVLVAIVLIFLGTAVVWSNGRRHRLQSENHILTTQNSDLEQKFQDAQSRIHATAAVGANAQAAYADILGRYAHLKNGTANMRDVDLLRQYLQSFVLLYPDEPHETLDQITALLKWIDAAKAGTITVKVQQLQANTLRSYAIECGIDLDNQPIEKNPPMNVNGDVSVNLSSEPIPWDPNHKIHVWMHLADSAYTACWGNFGPISMCSKEFLQEQSGTWREFFADQYGKDFKLGFTIERSFGPLPPLSP